MSIDAILASACAPLMFRAAQIDGESYWDGSYGANPSLWPLYEPSLDVDLLMVELTPLYRPEMPTSAKNILNRINEIASVNGLAAELRALALVNRHVPAADIRVHVISLPGSGYDAGAAWLDADRAALGQRSSVDVGERYLAGRAGSAAAMSLCPADAPQKSTQFSKDPVDALTCRKATEANESLAAWRPGHRDRDRCGVDLDLRGASGVRVSVSTRRCRQDRRLHRTAADEGSRASALRWREQSR